MHQLTERAELNRTHGRLAFSMLLFQDLAFVPFLALASALARGESSSRWLDRHRGGRRRPRGRRRAGRGPLAAAPAVPGDRAQPAARAVHAGGAVRGAGLGVDVAHARACRWRSAASSPGMMLAETEYRHQIETVIRPFRDILLGLFFITVGMLLDVRLLIDEFPLVSAHAARPGRDQGGGRRARHALVRRLVRSRRCAPASSSRSAASSASRCSPSCCRARRSPPQIGQPLLVAIVLSMVLSPFIISNNTRVARFLLREKGPPGTAIQREEAVTGGIARARARDPVRLRARRAEHRRACSSRRGSSTSRSIWIRRASAPRARPAIR